MLSCADLYRISSRLSVILNVPDVPFGGMNMIFAGNFAQLPPPMGGESSSLYGSCKGMFASSKQSQEMAMGKAVWHQVNTVVILHQNMRQRSQTLQDEKLRTALANIRYKDATTADIEFLQSRVVAKHGGPKLTDPEFHNMSIITGLNIHKDEYNHLGAIRFTEESGQELCEFYCDDKISGSKDSDQIPQGRGARSNVQGISNRLCQMLWAAMPSANDKQIPPVLTLCKGTVYAWSVSIGLHGKPTLDVVFIRLINPPSSVQLDGLPCNVIPVVCTSKTIVCTLPDDSTVKVSCMQVEITTNFAMTDFACPPRSI
ncbi:hypothetical protein IW262DRAFT_1449774 [Armillaria fumosa]|nr:hypothetical protein IW262DRAFT_1449774 [Armillaria fumosa]